MSPDAVLIAKAIVSLHPESDYLKDYIFPVALSFFSALLGGGLALYINRKQELKTQTKDNFIAANQTFVMAHECLNNLVAIKSNYVRITSDEPLLRAIEFPTMIAKLDDVKFNASTLYFIRTIPTANKKIIESIIWKIKHQIFKIQVKKPTYDELSRSWRNTVRISAMFSNYNMAMEFLRMRNKLHEQVKEPFLDVDEQDLVTLEHVYKKLGKGICGKYVDVTEQSIVLIDHVLIELNKFLKEFSTIAESNIELNRIKEWGRLLTHENNKPLFLECLKPLAKPNYEKLAYYVGATKEDAVAMYTYKDWD